MPDIYYDTLNERWVITGNDGKPREYISNGQSLITFKKTFVGTTPLTNVGTNAISVATLTNASGVNISDKVTVNPKSALADAVILSDVRVATTNCVVLRLSCPGIATAGSQAAVGWDVLVHRSE